MHAFAPERTVAVVGTGCRFPQATGTDEFWHNLVAGRDCVTAVPRERFDIAPYRTDTPGTPGKTVSHHGGFLDDPFSFDPGFFGISPAEAIGLDPQHRLLLPVVWEALEAAGITPSALAGSRSGVFIGQATADYADGVGPAGHALGDVTGSHLRAMAAGRISYALDLRGPSMTLDTACSSSLVAVHAARQSLLSGESRLAIAGGVNVILSPHHAIAYSQAAMLSPDGRCKFGDAAADGFVRSEGAGVVVLKLLSDALRDGDPVLALLAGSAVTNDGRGSGLLLKPAVSGQVAMLTAACASAGLRPADLAYIEAHGTGTTVGDTVELRTLAKALEELPAGRRMRTGSVKSNIGHTEAAAGIAGLIKTILIARHGLVPASLHQRTPHPLLTRPGFPVEVVTRNEPLRRAEDRAGDPDAPAVLGVSSFGLSGTNAHVVVAQYDAPPDRTPTSSVTFPPRTASPTASRRPEPPTTARPVHLLVLSARSRASLGRLAAAYAGHLGPGGAGHGHPLRDICATAALRRDAHPYRLWATGADHDGLAAVLRHLAAGVHTPHGAWGEGVFGPPRRTVFVFPGQGSQWAGMGRSLMASSPAFARTLRACEEAVRHEAGWSLTELLDSAEQDFPTTVEKVQPLLWAVEVALAAHWQDMGVTADVCMGHSMGEVAAAVVSGALTTEQGAAVICRRSRLMRSVAGQGGLLVTELAAPQAQEMAQQEGPGVCVAAENAPTTTVLAGDLAGLHRIKGRLDAAGVFNRFVKADVASHSPVMDRLTTELGERLAELTPTAAGIPLYSTVRGARVDGHELDGAYWSANLREPVRFHDGVHTLAKADESVFVEVSPHPVLQAAMEETLGEAGASGAVVASAHRGGDESADLAAALGRVFTAGGRVDWARWFGGPARHVPLPAYPWDEQHLRRTPATGGSSRAAGEVTADFPQDPGAAGVSLHGLTPVPPVVHLRALYEAATAAVREDAGEAGHAGHTGSSAFVIKEARVAAESAGITAAGGLTLRARLSSPLEGARTALVEAVPAGRGSAAPVTCLTATVHMTSGASGSSGASGPSRSSDRDDAAPCLQNAIDEALSRCHDYRATERFLLGLTQRGYDVPDAYGSAVRHLWRRNGEAVAFLARPDGLGQAAWEACLLPLLAAAPTGPSARHAYHPVSFGHVRFQGELTPNFWVMATFTPYQAGEKAHADVVVVGAHGRRLAEFRGIRLERLSGLSGTGSRAGSALRLPEFAAHLVEGAVRAPRALTSVLRGIVGPGRARAFTHYAAIPTGVPAKLASGTDPEPGSGHEVEDAPEQPGTEGRPAGPEASGETTGATALVQGAARILAMAPDRIDPRRPLRDYGLDSLMAARLRQQLLAEHGLVVSVTRLLGEESAERLGRDLQGAGLA
ncbi:type I polyketide synthase [Streptomyces sp. ISL-11]|uniref:type I polyketide synthase n=1 Tax=Streptomyces sp. ISL-11 TaxID=2819174 RepID=UPI001BEB6109|nr:type I polyketide synthase [Streptomyces sp. ISL-11]MBT2386640.1 acyltransferase domain-containing protein [Streptomyces sp. ISL-11]